MLAVLALPLWLRVSVEELRRISSMISPGARFPISEDAAKHVLALPIYPELTPEVIDYIAKEALAVCSKLQPSRV